MNPLLALPAAAMIGWDRCAILCHLIPRKHLGLPNKEDVKAGVITYSRSAGLDPATAREYHDKPRLMAGAETDCAKRSPKGELAVRRQVHQTLPQDGAKSAHFWSICGPHFCSIKITEDVRKYAKEHAISEEEAVAKGMMEKSKGFVESGAEVYTTA